MSQLLQNKPVQNKAADDAVGTGSRLPTSDDYADAARRRTKKFLGGGALLAAVVAAAFAGLDNILPPLVLLVAFLTPILIWRHPRSTLFLTLTAVCLLELALVQAPDGPTFADALTDRVPFFWNVNTIFQIYGHTNFKGIPLNLFEVFILIAGVCSCLRAVYTRTVNLRGGGLLVPIMVYMGFVLMGWLNGILSGGDFKISLQEVRPQLYFGLAYLLAVNIVRSRQDLNTALWITVVCIGVKAVLLTFRRYVTMHGQALPDQGVGAHEEAFFLDAFLLLLLALGLCRVQPRLQCLMWCLMPFVILGDLALNRRAGIAALVIAAPIILLAAYQALPDRRRKILAVGIVLSVGFSIYYPLFKNSDSAFAQPARAIKSNFQPDARDASSNTSRDNENVDLMATIKSAPIQGYGYGRPFFQIIPMTDVIRLYELEPYIPHNQVLWIWMRVGTFGFLAFWMMIAAIIVFAGQTIRAPGADDLTKAAGIFAMLMVVMLVIFGLLDLQLSNFRDVLFAGIWAGILAAAPSFNGISRKPGAATQ